MPRYFFNTQIGNETIVDRDGVDLRDADEAWDVAKATILDLLKDGGSRLLSASLIVNDEHGETVLEFPFAEAIMHAKDEETRH